MKKALVAATGNGATSAASADPGSPDPERLLGLLGPAAAGYYYEHADRSHWQHSVKRLNRRGGCLHVVDGAKCRRPLKLIAAERG